MVFMMSQSIQQLQTLKVPSSQLQLGMYVSELDCDWLATPFLFQGFMLDDPDDLFALKNLCDYVHVDVVKTRTMTRDLLLTPSVTEPRKPQASYKISSSIETEIANANHSYRESFREIRTMLDRVCRGETLDARRMIAAVRPCLDSIVRNPSALLWLTRIKHVDQYTAEHCLNVGIQAMALGRHMGLGIKHIELLGLCGMMHDVGKMDLDQAILNKPGRLTAEEFAHIKLHPVYGRDELAKDPNMPEEVIRVAYSHHERLDGKGYPCQLPASSLDFYIRAITIVDAYDAITSSRCYSSSHTSAEALKILYNNRGTQFDEKLVVSFIECIGIYPPGSLVEMNTGEVGVVLSVDPMHRLQPKIALVRDENKQPIEQVIVDLAASVSDLDMARYWVSKVLVDGSYGIDLGTFTAANIRLTDTEEVI
ncbi:HDIG domain-containing protein [Halopseudomonas xinjiangensis]|uniref:HDIG domain-containing protein n=1 Tax=Halopseudomonas xinjiangensis TaxID=487184 RepID=A0A1H1VRM1_9GAMM|nr:HD-GYP domain-containing protein [Halopseudomonas xinjiangensis]SDS87608.1 HDIG domain-containing protein [Halopseudomonas xinjiangensis]